MTCAEAVKVAGCFCEGLSLRVDQHQPVGVTARARTPVADLTKTVAESTSLQLPDRLHSQTVFPEIQPLKHVFMVHICRVMDVFLVPERHEKFLIVPSCAPKAFLRV